jgi:putative sterol carrier protein
MADFMDIATGKQNAQMAFMMGKLKIEGDMSVALSLGSILG